MNNSAVSLEIKMQGARARRASLALNPKARYRVGLALLLAFDAVALMWFFVLSVVIRINLIPFLYPETPPLSMRIENYYWIFPLWLLIFAYNGAYSKRFTFWDEVKALWNSSFFISIAMFTILFIGKLGGSFSRSVILTVSLLSLLFFPPIRIMVKRFLYSVDLLKRKIIIVGTGETALKSLSIIKKEKNLGYEVAAFISEKKDHPRQIEGIRVHGYIEKLERYIRRCSIHDVLIACPELKKEKLLEIINKIQHKAENTLYMPDLGGVAVLGTETRHFLQEQSLVIEFKNSLSRPLNYCTKRLFDYFLASMLSVLLIIPILVLALMVKLTSRGPAFFKQKRIGRGGRTFSCIKFRTMYLDADDKLDQILSSNPEARKEWLKYWKLKDDPRVTRFGRFLRVSSLDELPQVFNVLKGEMSLIGPRPYLEREWKYLRPFKETILSVPPGATGLWQVSGRNGRSFDERLALDSWYVKNWNLWLDFVVLLKTVYVIFKKEGVC